VGSRRCIGVVDARLEELHCAARRHGVTVNDAVLAAITAALRGFLADRGEEVDRFVVSIPVSSRESSTAGRLGNEIGIVPLELPGTGEPGARMEAIGAITALHKGDAPRSAGLLAPLFRTLAALGVLRWFTDHQHLVNTFVTNLRGPQSTARLLGRTVEQLIPLNSTSGNVRVAFGVFSYAGALTVTLVADEAVRDDLPDLERHLHGELAAVAAARPDSQGR
ncbi:MAG: WS/DGAT domain-containing protein, partial [Microthrixaceae bacterium]